MTATRDPDRILAAWLDLMPDEAPDRSIAAVLQVVEATPQQRPAPVDLFRRSHPMHRLAYLAAAVAVAVAVGGALLLTRSNGPGVGGPSPSPAASPSKPSAAASLAAGSPLSQPLTGAWFGGNRPVAGLEPGAGTVLNVSARRLGIVQSNQQETELLNASASVVDGRLQLVPIGGAGDATCDQGALGSYAFSVSPSGQTLTISDGRDACGGRLAALPGTWWLIDCKAGQSTCLGLMDAGTYSSQYFIPTLGAGLADWAPRYGGVQFAVPDGWANWGDWPQTFSLTTQSMYDSFSVGNDPSATIRVFANAMAESQARPCSGQPASGVATTPAAIATFLRGLTALQVTQPTTTSIGGRQGLAMDITVPRAPAKRCGTDDTVGIVEFLISQPWHRASDTAEVDTDGFAVGAKQRLILLGNGVGGVTAVFVSVDDASTFDAFVTQAMPVVQSFRFG